MHHPEQVVVARRHDQCEALPLPRPDAELLPGVPWGCFDVFLTPAFWAARAFIEEAEKRTVSFRIGATECEEVAGCLLGGYGMPAEVGLAALARLRDEDALRPGTAASRLETLLSKPLNVAGREIRYRFPKQKARHLAQVLDALVGIDFTTDDIRLRQRLLGLAGIGPKTASWIVRNLRNSDKVAILDVHICRACEIAGVFAIGSDPNRDYFKLERRFLAFANALSVRSSVLDDLIWQTMRRLPPRFRCHSA